MVHRDLRWYSDRVRTEDEQTRKIHRNMEGGNALVPRITSQVVGGKCGGTWLVAVGNGECEGSRLPVHSLRHPVREELLGLSWSMPGRICRSTRRSSGVESLRAASQSVVVVLVRKSEAQRRPPRWGHPQVGRSERLPQRCGVETCGSTNWKLVLTCLLR